VQEKNFWVFLYRGMHLIFVWLLLSCQSIYVITHIIYNHLVCQLM
jgi:hypothetical protein